jgi:DNA-3-methyladenine glycosylase
MYECLNLVAEPDGQPGCVLIRAIEPVAGLDLMRVRRGGTATRPEQLANGPGKLTLALGITRRHNGVDVTRGPLVVRHTSPERHLDIHVTPRIGITRSADLPLRFVAGKSVPRP